MPVYAFIYGSGIPGYFPGASLRNRRIESSGDVARLIGRLPEAAC
jgi:hypothetical protein